METASLEKLLSEIKYNENVFALLYKSGSEQSDCAAKRLNKLSKDTRNKILFIDVSIVKDVHTHFGITSAPSLLKFNAGKLVNVYKGCQTEEYYRTTINGESFSTFRHDTEIPAKRVTVYTTPTCTWCNTIKTYFREKNINFTEINVASNPAKAEEMVKKSGQQGVPQTDINGQMVIGFDKNKINSLLGIQ